MQLTTEERRERIVAEAHENGKVKVAGPEPKYHKVKSGDTIGRIAKKHGVSQRSILKLNGLTASSIIRPGQRLRVQ